MKQALSLETGRRSRLGFALLFSFGVSGCGFFSGVHVETVKTIAEQPGLVSVYLAVEKRGTPVDYLNESNFTLYENDVQLGKEVGFRLLPRDQYADGHTLLLLDVSGNPDAEYLKKLTKGATHFVQKVSTTQGVTVALFDGSAKIKRVASFSRVTVQEERAVPDLAQFAAGDPSRDLNGAVLAGVHLVTEELSHSSKPVKLASLVILARGPDLAGRKSDADLYQVLGDTPVDRFLITPEGVDFGTRDALKEDGEVVYKNLDELPIRMSELGMRVRKSWGKYYFAAYCSPARAGGRTLKIELRFDDEEGAPVSASGETSFVSDGFSSGCVVPSSKGREPAPVQIEPTAVAPAPTPIEVTPKKPKATPKKPSEPKPASPKPGDDKVVAPKSDKYD